MPLLMTAIFITVQFSLLYLGNQVVSSAARQASRVARTTGDQAAAELKGEEYASKVGHGLVEGVTVHITNAPNGDIKAVASGKALQLVPGLELGQVTRTVQGPPESFRPDGP
jgi:Flp pilus assembly protein TadG